MYMNNQVKQRTNSLIHQGQYAPNRMTTVMPAHTPSYIQRVSESGTDNHSASKLISNRRNSVQHSVEADKSEWQVEAMRLSRRIMDLELQNASLRQQLRPALTKEKHMSGGATITFAGTSRLVAAAAAASRRRRRDIESASVASLSPRRDLDTFADLGTGMKRSHTYNYLSQAANDTHTITKHTKAEANLGLELSSLEPVARPELVRDESTASNFENEMKRLENSIHSHQSVMNVSLTTNSEEGECRPSELLNDTDPSPANVSKLTEKDVRIWVGTWNMGAADPFSDSNGIIDEQTSALMIQGFVSHGYDLYVIGIQEGVSENVYHAIVAFLNRNPHGERYYRSNLQNCEFLIPHKTHTSDTVLDAVRGRGDGAFMGTKFTGVAVFYAAAVQDDIALVRAAVHKFNIASGSKGGVAVGLRIRGTTLVFVNCHLDAKNDSNRREQIRQLNTYLGRNMGHGSFDLTEQFHHVIWMGDLNYRIHTLDPETVLHMLSQGRNQDLHDRFDGLLADQMQGVFFGFMEAQKHPTFYPTYKKYEHRGPIDTCDTEWPSKVYRVQYKEPFYKGGQVKSRVPGWCDRILVHTVRNRTSKLIPEKIMIPGQDSPVDNYRSINDGIGMDISDHSPVICTFILSLLNNKNQSVNEVSVKALNRFSHPFMERPISTVLRVSNMVLHWYGHQTSPKKVRFVVPLLGEDESNRQVDVVGERASGSHLLSVTNVVVQHTRPIQQLHMLVWARHEAILGHNVVSLTKLDPLSGSEVRFTIQLRHNSLDVFHEGYPVKLSFSVRAILSQ